MSLTVQRQESLHFKLCGKEERASLRQEMFFLRYCLHLH